MLRDMPKFSSHKINDKGLKKQEQAFRKRQWEDAPLFEAIRPKALDWKEGGGISSRPLERYLKQSVGKSWATVCRKIPREYAESLRRYVRTDIQKEIDGLYTAPNSWLSGAFFVENGILRMIPRTKRWRCPKVGVIQPVYQDCYNPARRWTGRRVAYETVEFNGKLYTRRAGLWYRTDYVGERDVTKWDEELVRYVKTGTESVFKEFQISRKEKRRIEQYIQSRTQEQEKRT